jgi:hypothetical protein
MLEAIDGGVRSEAPEMLGDVGGKPHREWRPSARYEAGGRRAKSSRVPAPFRIQCGGTESESTVACTRPRDGA